MGLGVQKMSYGVGRQGEDCQGHCFKPWLPTKGAGGKKIEKIKKIERLVGGAASPDLSGSVRCTLWAYSPRAWNTRYLILVRLPLDFPLLDRRVTLPLVTSGSQVLRRPLLREELFVDGKSRRGKRNGEKDKFSLVPTTAFPLRRLISQVYNV